MVINAPPLKMDLINWLVLTFHGLEQETATASGDLALRIPQPNNTMSQ